ncbi:MAG: glycosyltransferase family 4 protein [Rhodospirillales bacterium]|nr:glycosyltransferase family 4 protein [Rhodospirillales bacterium]
MSGQPRLLFVTGDDGFFFSHIMPVALAARDAGFAVAVACPVAVYGDAIRGAGMRVFPIPLKRGRVSPLADLRTLAALLRICRAEWPDIVHPVAMKPVLYGAAAARLSGVPAIVGVLTGLGYVFTSGDIKARVLRPLLRRALRWALDGRRSTCIVQNPDDAVFIAGLGLDERRIVVILGCGVDTARFAPSPEPKGPVRIAMVARLLWDKGVGEFVEAARIARTQDPNLRFTLIGAPDEGNPAAVPLAQLEGWRDDGLIDWQGHRDDIPAVWRESHIAVLPSYREGLPKALLEAASSGRPIVAADVPGSREIVRGGESGLLVPPRDPAALAAAILRLADDPPLRARLGAGGRRLVERHFSEDRIAAETLALWRRLLDSAGTGR